MSTSQMNCFCDKRKLKGRFMICCMMLETNSRSLSDRFPLLSIWHNRIPCLLSGEPSIALQGPRRFRFASLTPSSPTQVLALHGQADLVRPSFDRRDRCRLAVRVAAHLLSQVAAQAQGGPWGVGWLNVRCPCAHQPRYLSRLRRLQPSAFSALLVLSLCVWLRLLITRPLSSLAPSVCLESHRAVLFFQHPGHLCLHFQRLRSRVRLDKLDQSQPVL